MSTLLAPYRDKTLAQALQPSSLIRVEIDKPLDTAQFHRVYQQLSKLSKPEVTTRKANRTIFSILIQLYHLRLLVSEVDPNGTPTKVTSISLYNGAVAIDLDQDNRKIEIVLINKSGNNYEVLSQITQEVLLLVLDSILLYNESERKSITAYFNKLADKRDDPTSLTLTPLIFARQLKLEDMVWGGLAGNAENVYTVAHKAAGERKFLIFAPTGIWLLAPPDGYTRLTLIAPEQLYGTILVGTLIDKENRRKLATSARYWLDIFDIISYLGDTGVQLQPHKSRMVSAESIIEIFNKDDSLLHLTTVSQKFFNSPLDFFSIMNELFAQRDVLPFATEGFIFTSATAPYNLKVEQIDEQTKTSELVAVSSLPIQQRILTKYPDIVQWTFKSPTFNFLYKQKGLYGLVKGQYVLFKGTKRYPFSGFVSASGLLNSAEGKVVEFSWNNNRFLAEAILTRSLPDEIQKIEDKWLAVRQPITQELLQGNTYNLFDNYINRIKRGLSYDKSVLVLTNSNVRDYQKLINKQTKRIAFLLLDSDSVTEMTTPSFSPGYTFNPVGDITFTQNGVVVGKNAPIAPFPLDTLLSIPRFRLVELHRADTEHFLTLNEQILGRLYIFGMLEEITSDRPKAFFIPAPTTSTPVQLNTPQVGPAMLSTPLRRLPRTRRGFSSSSSTTIAREGLPILPVIAPVKGHSGPGRGDDKVERLIVSWANEPVFRIACIGDGSCFLHAYLKGFVKEYQDNNEYTFRRAVIRRLRDELADLLTQKDAKGKTVYSRAVGGAWVELASSGAQLTDELGVPIDYSIEGLIKLLKSDRDIGDEMYGYIVEVCNIDIYVVTATKKDVLPHIFVGTNKPIVVIAGTGYHYELIAVERNGLLQTLFDPSDKFIKQLKERFSKGLII